MLKFFGPIASRVRRVWMLKECDLDFDPMPSNFCDGSTCKPAFLAINPDGLVPANPPDVTLAAQWNFWFTTEIKQPLLIASSNQVLFAKGCRDELHRSSAARQSYRATRRIRFQNSDSLNTCVSA